MISGFYIFYLLLGGTVTLLYGLFHFILKKLSESAHKINSLLAEKPREKSTFHKFIREYINRALDESKRDRVYSMISLISLPFSFLLYLKWQNYYTLAIPMSIIIIVFFMWYVSAKFYEKKFAKCKGMAKNFPIDFNDFLDRLEVSDEDERKELTKIYAMYEEKGLEEYKEELFDKLP